MIGWHLNFTKSSLVAYFARNFQHSLQKPEFTSAEGFVHLVHFEPSGLL